MSATGLRRVVLCILAVWACARLAAAQDGHLYQWLGPDGSLHITETPPPPDGKLLQELGPASESAAPAPEAAPPAPPAAPPPAPPEQADDADPCAPHAALVDAWVDAVLEVRAAEREIDRLEADPVLASRGDCIAGSGLFTHCTDTDFSRERELERAHERRDAAEARLARADESARRAGVPQRCLVEPDE